MKKITLLGLMAVAVAITVSSCKSSDSSNIPVPQDAAFVLHLNNTSLSSKLSWNEIKEGAFFKEMHAEAKDSLLQQILNDPDNSGMDTHQEFYLFLKNEGKGGYAVFEGTLKDAAAFEKFNKQIAREANTVKAGDLNSIQLSPVAVATWQGTRFAYVFNAPVADVAAAYSGGGMSEVHNFPADTLVQFGKAVYSISGKSSIGSDERFADLIKESGDVHFWVNSEKYLGGFSNMLGMLKAGDLLKGNISAATFSFDNGKITMKSKAYMNEQLTKLYSDYPAQPLSTEMLNRIPSGKVTGVLAMNYPPKGLKEFIKLTGLDGFANSYIEKAGYSIDEFVKANKGDLMVTFTDLTVARKKDTLDMGQGNEPYIYEKTSPDVKVLFATSINDKGAFDKLIQVLSAESKNAGMDKAAESVKYQLDNNWFVAGNDPAQLGKFLSGGNSNQLFVSRLSGHSFGLYVDLQQVIGSMSGSTDEKDKAALDASLKMWQDILVTGDPYKKGGSTSVLEINLVDKNTNSLKQLNQYLNTLASLYKKNHDDAAVAPPAATDTITVTPPVK